MAQHYIGRRAELTEGTRILLDVGAREIGVLEHDGRVVCPWHGYEFDLASGRCANDPRLRLRRYDVIERDGEVYIDV